jgi:hypothetical protein
MNSSVEECKGEGKGLKNVREVGMGEQAVLYERK